MHSQYFDLFHVTYFSATLLVIEIVTIIHILLNKHEESASAVLWLLIVIYLPLLGLLLYLFFGINRINTRGPQIKLSNQLMMEEKNSPVHKAFLAHYKEQRKYIFSANDSDYQIFQKSLDRQLPETLPLSGNKVELLKDGTLAYPKMLEEISKSKQSIHLQSFIIMNDKIGKEILGALEQKARSGVHVRVLYDRLGSFKAGFLYKLYGRGIPNFEIRVFSPLLNFRMPWMIQLRNHRKLLIVDGETAFVGGINISSDNDKRWSRKDRYIHDLHCRIKGPAVGEFQFSFIRDWFYVTSELPSKILREEYFPLLKKEGDSVIRVVASGPGHFYEATEKVFMTAMSTAQKYVWIITPYFVPDKSFWKSMISSVARGVDVMVIVPKKNNHWYVQYASQSKYLELLGGGVRIFEKEGSFSHAKAMLVDGEWAYMGSSNCDLRSFRLNFELDFVVTKGEFISQLHQQFLEEFSMSKEIYYDTISNKPLSRKLIENACSLLTPIL